MTDAGSGPTEIADDEVLTQYGTRHDVEDVTPAFRVRPRFGIENDVSLLRGRWAPDEARGRVRFAGGAAGPDEGVRYTVAGALRASGFVVTATPLDGTRTTSR